MKLHQYIFFSLLFFFSIQESHANIPDINEDDNFRGKVIKAWLAGHSNVQYEKNHSQLTFTLTSNRNDVEKYFGNLYSHYGSLPILELLTEHAFYLFSVDSPNKRSHFVCMYKDYFLSRKKRTAPNSDVKASHDCTPFELTLELTSPVNKSTPNDEIGNDANTDLKKPVPFVTALASYEKLTDSSGDYPPNNHMDADKLLHSLILVHARNYPIGPVIIPKAVSKITTNQGTRSYSFTDDDTTDERPTLHFSSFQAVKPHERGNWGNMDFALITRASRFKGRIWGGISQDIITVGPYTISDEDIIVVEKKRLEEFKKVNPSFKGKLITFDNAKTSLRAAVQEGLDSIGAPRVMEKKVGGPVLIHGKNIDDALFFKPLIDQGFVYSMHGNSVFYKIEGALRNLGSDMSLFHDAEKTSKEAPTSFPRRKSIHELMMLREAYFAHKKELLHKTKNLGTVAQDYLKTWCDKNEEWLKLIEVEIKLGLQNQAYSLFTNTTLLKEAMKGRNDPHLLGWAIQKIKYYSVPPITGELFNQKIFHPLSIYDDTLPEISSIFLALPYDDFVQALKNIRVYNPNSDELILSCIVARLAMMYKVQNFPFDQADISNLNSPREIRNFYEVNNLLNGESKTFPGIKKFNDFSKEIRNSIRELTNGLSEYSQNKPTLTINRLQYEVQKLLGVYEI